MAVASPPAGSRMRGHLARVEETNRDAVEQVARAMLQVVRADGLIFLGGTGHSVALVLEGFYRAGGLACVYPVYHPALLPLEGAAASTQLERTAGLGRTLVRRVGPTPADLAVIFSHSGINPVPVEMAEEFRAAGTPTVGVVSREHMGRAPARHPCRLGDVVDHLLDTLVPYGDAALDPGTGTPTMPLSTLAGVFLWNLLLVRLGELAAASGVALPVWVSANVEGGQERNAALLERYRRRVPLL
ncbi:MAG: SIS domain-containing protein [Armatimonadota bacterium]|nr:SIS domain-containing protein [Armatimonadota bacterium]MDR7402195.1 SIS domain-containing protein [Armatimonadota bacterium]MDR7405050.1 SIS domain-containing protein [Armatimonadota bacterium]MDR7436952.1 SIS domain-containing protein [Armatimonadota bacterium]MDR7472274.1 SIS domain-containing protein [Armatimonadota bacterium]